MWQKSINKVIDLIVSIKRQYSKNAVAINKINARSTGKRSNMRSRFAELNQACINEHGQSVVGNDLKIGANVRPETLKRWHKEYTKYGIDGLMSLPRDAHIK